MPLGDNNDFSILFGPQARSRLVAAALRGEKAPPVGDELAQALERSRGAGDLATLLAASGDPAMAQLAHGIRAQAEQDVQAPEQRLRYARDAEQTRQMQDRAERLRDPGSPATALRRTLAKKWAPEIDASQMTGMDLEPDMPLMERSYAADLRRVAAGGRGAGGGGGAGGGAAGKDDAKAIADEVEAYRQSPDLRGLFKMGPQVRAELARRGFNLAKAQSDWNAIQKHLSSLNSSQQLTLRNNIESVGHQLDVLEGLYDDWKRQGYLNRFKGFNKAAIAAAKQAGGEAGAAANTLESQVNMLAGEVSKVMRGGAGSDQAVKEAHSLISADLDPVTFEAALKNVKRDINIRLAAMANSAPLGVSADSLYARQAAPAGHAGAPAAPGPGPAPSAAPAAQGGPTVLERRTINGRTLEKLSDGSIREVK